MLRLATAAARRSSAFAPALAQPAQQQLQRGFASAAAEDEFKPPLKLHGLSGRYASALYTAAGKAGTLSTVEKELASVLDLTAKDAKFKQFLEDPTMNKAKKVAGLMDFCEGAKFSDTTKSFLKVVAENGRLTETGKIASDLEELLMASRGEVKAVVTSAEALSPAQMTSLTAALGNHVGKGQTLKLKAVVDSKIVGGLTVSIGEKYLDLSLLTRIKKVEAVLAAAI